MKPALTPIPQLRRVFSLTYANLPTTGIAAEDLGWAIDREVLYRWSGSAWVAITKYAGSDTYANIPTAANLPDGSSFYATDREVAYQVQSGAWQPVTIYLGHGNDAAKPAANTLPEGSLYRATDTSRDYQVQSAAWVDVTPAGATLTVAETEVHNAAAPTTWTDLDLSATIGANEAFLVIKVILSAGAKFVAFRKNGDTDEFFDTQDTDTSRGCALSDIDSNTYVVLIVRADSSGIIEWKAEGATSTIIKIITTIR